MALPDPLHSNVLFPRASNCIELLRPRTMSMRKWVIMRANRFAGRRAIVCRDIRRTHF
jgi:hypothetical protein